MLHYGFHRFYLLFLFQQRSFMYYGFYWCSGWSPAVRKKTFQNVLVDVTGLCNKILNKQPDTARYFKSQVSSYNLDTRSSSRAPKIHPNTRLGHRGPSKNPDTGLGPIGSSWDPFHKKKSQAKKLNINCQKCQKVNTNRKKNLKILV